CPAHADVISTRAGKCPECGAKLSLSPKEKMKMEVMKKFTCPMHPDATSDKAGKCPKCGMDLTEKK
ncbi:MAG TPA: heavy metal-binding domain-containing protein, partial [Chitinophagaceae bacterium]|nr:heavy metal-binding domain-containing protein [Chitinophagaceae bacterium]